MEDERAQCNDVRGDQFFPFIALLQQTASVTPVLERKLVAIEEQRYVEGGSWSEYLVSTKMFLPLRNLLMKQLQTALSDRDTVIAGREEEKRRHESVVDELRAECI